MIRARRWLLGGTMSVGLLFGMLGCDYFAQKDLKPGVSTSEDVRKYMGQPEMIWEETDGSKTYEYVRAPAGTETYMVTISPDGKFQSMRNVLVSQTFAQVKVGMSSDDVRRLLGKPTDKVFFKLKQEDVWSWKHVGDQQRAQMFNVHFDPDHKVRSTSISADPATINH